MVSVELVLDDGAEAAVRGEWAALAGAQLSSMGANGSASNRPHVTLLARPEVPVDALAAAGLDDALPLPLLLGPPMLFGAGDRRVLVRAIAPSGALLALQARVREAAGAHDDADAFLPGSWMPHVTLARRLRVDDLPSALALLGGPIEATATGIRHWAPETATVTRLA